MTTVMEGKAGDVSPSSSLNDCPLIRDGDRNSRLIRCVFSETFSNWTTHHRFIEPHFTGITHHVDAAWAFRSKENFLAFTIGADAFVEEFGFFGGELFKGHGFILLFWFWSFQCGLDTCEVGFAEWI